MAINLRTLNTTEVVTLKRPEVQPVSYRLDTDKIKENWDEIKANSMDLVAISKEAGSYESTLKVEDIQNLGELKKQSACNYSVEAFFRKDMPKITTDGGYLVGGAHFSKEELEQCRMVMKAAVDGIGCGIGQGTNIDYRNYARMGIAESSVKAYAAEHLTEEQAAVVNRAMQEYSRALIDLEQQTLADAGYKAADSKEPSDYYHYYGKVKVLNDDEINAINKLKEEMSRLTGRYYTPTRKGATGTIQSATNQQLIGEIKDLFSNLDCSDEEAVNAAAETYKELMRPVYIAAGRDDEYGSLTRALNADVADFKKQIADIMMAVNYHATDYMM